MHLSEISDVQIFFKCCGHTKDSDFSWCYFTKAPPQKRGQTFKENCNPPWNSHQGKWNQI